VATWRDMAKQRNSCSDGKWGLQGWVRRLLLGRMSRRLPYQGVAGLWAAREGDDSLLCSVLFRSVFSDERKRSCQGSRGTACRGRPVCLWSLRKRKDAAQTHRGLV
jgi:hypothetical protein